MMTKKEKTMKLNLLDIERGGACMFVGCVVVAVGISCYTVYHMGYFVKRVKNLVQRG
jgi:hypothetical protein